MELKNKLKTWFDNRTVYTKILIIILSVVLTVFLLERLFFLYLYINSVQGGLTVFLQTDTSFVSEERNQDIDVSFETSVQNLPFCTATCTWSLIDLQDRTTKEEGTLDIESGQTKNISTTISTPKNRTVSPYRIRVHCTNEATRYCQASQGQSVATKTVNTTYSENERQQKDLLRQESTYEDIQVELQKTRVIANTTDTRITSLRNISTTVYQELKSIKKKFEEAVAQDDPVQARKELTTPPLNTSDRYEELLREEQQNVDILNNIISNTSLYKDLYLVSDNKTIYRENMQRFTTIHSNLTQKDISETNTELQSIQQFLTNQNKTRLEQVRNTTSTEVSRQEQQICTATQTSCQTPPRTITQACSYIENYDTRQENKKRQYATSIRPNQTVEETRQEFNVSGFKNSTNYTNWEQDILQKLRQNQTVTLNETETLALTIPITERLQDIENEYCQQTIQIPTTQKETRLQPLPQTTVEEPPEFPKQQCCALGECRECSKKNKTPLLIIHGHAITETTSPEYSLQSLIGIAQQLEKDNVLHYGHIFPTRNYVEGEKELLSKLPGGLSFTGTYYADTFEEEGQQSRLVTKSETIETYSIRLSELIDSVLAETRQDQVKIIAHSMGGLVTRSYLQNFGEDKVERVTLVGTPNQGISGRTSWFCPRLGSENECRDMQRGSSFLTKIGSHEPQIPIQSIVGVGCGDRDYDGVIFKEEAWLEGAQNQVFNGTCEGPLSLHSKLIRPARMHEPYIAIREFMLSD